jgi:hypothetical protein
MARKFLIPVLLIILFSCEKLEDKNQISIKYYGDALEDIGYSIAATNDGYVIGGQLTNVVRQSSYINPINSIKQTGIIRTKSDGNAIWKYNFGKRLSGTGSKVLVLQDGSVVVAGFVTDTVTLQKDSFVVKTNSDGLNAVEKHYKMSGNQFATDIIETETGFIILGSTDVAREPLTESSGNATGKKDILILTINSNLEPVRAPLAIGFPNNDSGVAIKRDINGYVVAGTTDRSEKVSSIQSGNNILIVRINSDGSATQPRIIGGTREEVASDFEVLDDGYLITGTIGAEGSVKQAFVLELSSDIYADVIFDETNNIDLEPDITTKTTVSIHAICRYKANSFIVAGQFGTGSSGRMLLFVTDASGKYVEGKKLVYGGTGTQVVHDVITDTENNIIAVGKNSYENNSMISLIKFRF